MQWDTSASNAPLLASLESALLPPASGGLASSLQDPSRNTPKTLSALTGLNATTPASTSQIPKPIPDWYSLHYLTLCSGSFIFSTDPTVQAQTSITKRKDPSSIYCTPRWLDQRANLTQILISAASKSLRNPRLYPPTLYDETTIESLSTRLGLLVQLEYYYDVSPVLPAVATLIIGFAFAVFSLPLVLLATYIAVTDTPVFRLLPHAAIAFAALSAIFLTASALLVTGMGNLFSGITPGITNVSASTSPSFLGFEWAGAMGMWCVVFFVWLGGVWGQRVIVITRRKGEKGGAYDD